MRFSVMEKPDTSSEQRKKQYTNHILLEVKNDVGKAWRCIRASSAARPRNIPKPFPTSFLTDKIMWLVLLSIAIVSPNYVFNLLRSKWLFSGFLGLDRGAKIGFCQTTPGKLNWFVWSFFLMITPLCKGQATKERHIFSEGDRGGMPKSEFWDRSIVQILRKSWRHFTCKVWEKLLM